MNENGRLTQKISQKLSDTNSITLSLKSGQGGQALFEYTDEVMGVLYKKAHYLLAENQVDNAVDAFTFLTTLNPFHSEYWMGLGAALQLGHDYEAAIDAYEMAAIYNIENPLPYLYLGKCLFAIHDRKSALQSFELAIAYADEIEEYAEIKEEAEKAKKHLLSIDAN